MIHRMKTSVYYADTDAYGHVWHGTYIRWMEMARMEFFKSFGVTLKDLQNVHGILIPIVELKIRYKSPAKVDETIVVESTARRYGRSAMIFDQNIMNAEDGTLHIKASIKGVTTNPQGKLNVDLPQIIVDCIEKISDEQ